MLNWELSQSIQMELSFWYRHIQEYKAQRKGLEWREIHEKYQQEVV